jgi:hypothetical protein
LHRFEVAGFRFIRFLELADPCVQNTFSNAKSLGYINNSMAFVDDLFDRLFLEFSRIFCSLHFFHSNAVLTWRIQARSATLNN